MIFADNGVPAAVRHPLIKNLKVGEYNGRCCCATEGAPLHGIATFIFFIKMEGDITTFMFY
jgi:hypothetical protein